jgi:hypothetical protein
MEAHEIQIWRQYGMPTLTAYLEHVCGYAARRERTRAGGARAPRVTQRPRSAFDRNALDQDPGADASGDTRDRAVIRAATRTSARSRTS